MTPEMEALLRKHVQDGVAANEEAVEKARKMAVLNSKLIFLNGAGRVPRRGLEKLSDAMEKEIEETIDG